MNINKKDKKNINLTGNFNKLFYKILDSVLNKTIIEDKYLVRIKILKKEIYKKFIKKNFKFFSSKLHYFFKKNINTKNIKHSKIKYKYFNKIKNLNKDNIYKFKLKKEKIKKAIKTNIIIFSLLKSYEKFKYSLISNSKKYILSPNEKTFFINLKEQLIKLIERKILKKFFSRVKKNNFESNYSHEEIATLYYCDHCLFIAKLFKSKNLLSVDLIIELPIPAKVIGDNFINNIDELIEITLDAFQVLNLSKPPMLLILSSSFFNIKSFKNNNLPNEDDEIIINKSPYLPEDTLVNIDNTKNENNYVLRTLYTRKAFMNGWIKTLQKLDSPVIGITTPGPHQFDILRSNKKLINDIEIIVDIELTTSTVFICTKDYKLNSQKLPYGSNLYNKQELIESYFSRLIKSIKLITKDNKIMFPELIYVSGFGLDEFDNYLKNLPYPFIRFSQLNKLEFNFDDKESQELINNKFDSKLNLILEIANKCL